MNIYYYCPIYNYYSTALTTNISSNSSDLYWILLQQQMSNHNNNTITPSSSYSLPLLPPPPPPPPLTSSSSSSSSSYQHNNNNSTNQQQQQQQQEDIINHYQNEIDHLFYEWNSINIVLESIRNAFTIKENLTEQHLDEVDKELSIAYDDLMSQVRHLERRLKRMSKEINEKLIVVQQHANIM